MVAKSYSQEPKLLEVVNEELLKGYQKRTNDRDHVTAMAWLCNVLGVSGERKYKATLDKVVKKGGSRKLRKYAKKNSRRLR